MANVTRIYSADFGAGKTGLATVGYTLTGSARTTSGVSESPAGSGIYSASITHSTSFAGSIVWDTGDASIKYAIENIYPSALAATGVDDIAVESGVNLRQALSSILSACAGVLLGAGTGTVTIKAGANPATLRITAETDDDGNRTSVILNLPS